MSSSGHGSWPRARRWFSLGAGFALLAVGAALLVLPGPGIPLVLAGLALLGRELPWARRLRAWIHAKVRERLKLGRERSSRRARAVKRGPQASEP